MIVSTERIIEIIKEELQKLVREGWKKKKYKKNDYKKYNKLVKRGKSVMVQTAYGDEFAWEDGSNYGVFASEEDGREIELDHDDIVDVMHEGNLTEMDNPWFEITYKDSRGRTKTDSMRANNPKEAKKDFVNLMKGRGFKVLKVVKEGRTRLSKIRDLDIHSGGSMAQVYGKNAVVALDKKSMKELVRLIRMNMGLYERLVKIMEGKKFTLSNGVKVEFIGKMQLKLTNYKGKSVLLDVGELRMFLKGAKKDMGVSN